MPEPGPRNRRLETAGLVALLALAAWFYLWTATSAGSPLTWERPHYDLYNRLADGFLAGRTSFLEEPPAELAKLSDPYDPTQNAPYRQYHDVSYYRGRYYLYFGPTPALVLLAPWKLVTGTSLPQNLAVAVFAWGAALIGVLLLRGLRDRHFPGAPSWVLLAAATAAVFGNMLPVLLRRPVYYELAIASACCFGLAAMGCFFRAQGETGRARAGWLAGAGLSLGLGIAARPDYLFGAAAVVAIWHGLIWRRLRPKTAADCVALARSTLPLWMTLAFAGLALLAYNYVRFDRWLEFGMRYQLAGSNQLELKFMSPWFLGPNLYFYFLALPRLSAYFPFIQVTGLPTFSLPAGYSGQENMYGLVATMPWLFGLWWLWRAVRRRDEQDGLREFALVMGGLPAGILFFLLLIAGANNRYLVDFVPAATVLAGAGVLAWSAQATGWQRWAGNLGWGAALVWTAGFNVLVSLQHNDLFRFHNPAGYARLARTANRVAETFTGASATAGPLRIEITLPRERTGKLEPLVVTGWSFRADFLYVFYKDERHIQIGFEHTSYGGPMSPPLRVDYDVPHVLEVDLGSLYPPREHPYFDGWSEPAIANRKRSLVVKLDGRVVHEGLYDTYDASPGDVSIGRNHVSEAFGRRFTGVIRRVERPARRE
jgi:hypothetical protein